MTAQGITVGFNGEQRATLEGFYGTKDSVELQECVREDAMRAMRERLAKRDADGSDADSLPDSMRITVLEAYVVDLRDRIVRLENAPR
jgi:hypothetical protein